MAISVQTDLVLDVLKAGRSEEIAAAKQKLQAMKPMEIAAAGADFAAELLENQLADRKLPDGQSTDGVSGIANLREQPQMTADLAAFQKFEAVILEQFVKHMLPEDTEVIFGEGTAGEIWKGMMAQQIGATISEAGGIGIANHMLGSFQGPNTDRASNIIFSQERDIIDSLDENNEQ